MKTHDVIQGSPEWLALRTTTYNASDAPAMLGCSPYTTRTELIARLATGITPEVTPEQQRLFDDGHLFERLARPLAEKVIGEDLYPISGSEDYGLAKPLGASLDGATITDERLWEHKTLNDYLRSVLPETGVGSHQVGASLRKDYRVQMEQQLMVDKDADEVLFTASKWVQKDGEWVCVEARHCWYKSDPALRAEILAGWKQAEIDAAAYVPAEPVQKLVAEPVEALPSVVVNVSGSITITDNFKKFEVAIHDFLEHRLIREPKTDQDFADLDIQIKAMKGAEAALEAAEANWIAQMDAVSQAKRTKDMLAKLVRDNRLMAEKLLASEKERRRGEIVAGGVSQFKAHIDGLNQRLGKPYMPPIPADFGAAIKGMRSLSSMEDAVATTLAQAKITANETADKIDLNLKWLRDNATEYAGLFADTATLVLKPHDDFVAVAQNRITTEQARVQAEHDRIREEAAARARQELADQAAARQQPAAAPAAPAMTTPAAAAPVRVNQTQPAAADARINLGRLNERLCPVSLTADGLTQLGFPAMVEKASKTYREADVPAIAQALISHLSQFCDELQEA